jgi:hypothetical protein
VVLPTVLDLVTEMKRKVSWRRPRLELGCRAKKKKIKYVMSRTDVLTFHHELPFIPFHHTYAPFHILATVYVPSPPLHFTSYLDDSFPHLHFDLFITRLHYDRFLTNPFQFITVLSSALYNLVNESVVKENKRNKGLWQSVARFV